MIGAGDAILASDFTGLILMWAGSSAPAGWLICDGSAVSRTTYSSLFAIVGTTFGAGDGSTTFNLPDMRGRSVIGVGTGTKTATVASVSGNVFTVTGISNKANNEFQTGQAVVFTATVAGNLVTSTTYYLVRTGNLTFSVASSLANAQNGTVITLAGTERGSFQISLAVRALADTGGEEAHAMSSTELLAHTHSTPFAAGPSGAGSTGTIAGTTSSGSTGGNAAMNNMQPYVVLNYIVKT